MGDRRHPGRPLTAGAPRYSRLQLRLTKDEDRAIVDAAKRAGQSVSDWARAALVAATKRENSPA